MPRSLVSVLVLLLALAAAAAWWFTRAPQVPALTLRLAPLVRTLQFSARVTTAQRVDLGATITGRVAEVLAREGDSVKRGAPLLRLETDELNAALAQAQAAEAQAQARLAGLRSTGRRGTQAAQAQADAGLLAAQAEFKRAQDLVAQGFVSPQRLDDAKRALDVAQAQAASARAQSAANAEQGTDIAQAQAALAAAQAATGAARARLAQAAISAPADARVLARHVEPGQIVQPGRALLTLALAGPLQIEAQVDERYLAQLQAGQEASVLADAFPDRRFTARVLNIAPLVDAQRGAVEVKLLPPTPTPDFLREDMTLSVEVVTARRDSALVLPLAALRNPPGSAAAATDTVLLLQDGRAQARTVRLGLRTLDAAEVKEGLSPGDTVLLGPAVTAGQRVTPQALSASSASAALAPRPRAEDAGSAMTNAMGR
ncbi:RND family efflux transporter, MFP subunit [Burkholderiales bacterium JOSHI_001]|nr:RND family efflux transporter, MFP subunit [Burkholderiales bacterium JOSHI_001]